MIVTVILSVWLIVICKCKVHTNTMCVKLVVFSPRKIALLNTADSTGTDTELMSTTRELTYVKCVPSPHRSTPE